MSALKDIMSAINKLRIKLPSNINNVEYHYIFALNFKKYYILQNLFIYLLILYDLKLPQYYAIHFIKTNKLSYEIY